MIINIISVAFLFSFIDLVVGYESQYDLQLSQRYVQFCGAAYCCDPILKKNSVDDWSCQACKNFPGTVAKSFHGNISDANGFVAYEPSANEIIVSFSGTDPLSIQNWIDDFNFFKTSYPYCDGCEVHEGFYNSYLSADTQVKTLVDQMMSFYPTASLAITGHSLGAAMAAHCAAELTHSGYKVKTVYSYGMPRVGNQAFEQWYIQKLTGTFRVVHRKDPVPHLAPENWGFHHMPYEVFYIQDYKDWKLCSIDGEDPSCADQYLTALDVENHLHYLDMDFTTNYLSCQL